MSLKTLEQRFLVLMIDLIEILEKAVKKLLVNSKHE